jgi:ComF family protein
MRKDIAVNLNGPLKVNNAASTFFTGNRCFLCSSNSKGHETICQACLRDLPHNTDACPACAKPGAASRLCADCLNQTRTFVDNTWTLFRYQYPVNRLIQHMKFNQGIDIANHLGRMLGKLFLNHRTALPDCIIPVPLHYRRLIARGYNQSLEIARPLSRQLGIKLDTSSCKRFRATTPQSNLLAKKRRQNVRNAFSASKTMDYKHILLVDDVITTGSTVNELARTLGLAGVHQIDVLAVARAG